MKRLWERPVFCGLLSLASPNDVAGEKFVAYHLFIYYYSTPHFAFEATSLWSLESISVTPYISVISLHTHSLSTTYSTTSSFRQSRCSPHTDAKERRVRTPNFSSSCLENYATTYSNFASMMPSLQPNQRKESPNRSRALRDRLLI